MTRTAHLTALAQAKRSESAQIETLCRAVDAALPVGMLERLLDRMEAPQ
jgi:hypothetical protein